MTANVSGLTATPGNTTITLSWTNPDDIPANQSPCAGDRQRTWHILRRESWNGTGPYVEIAFITATGANPYNGHTSYVDTPPSGGPWDYIVYAQDNSWQDVGGGECEFRLWAAGANAFASNKTISGDDDPSGLNFADLNAVAVDLWYETSVYTVAGLGTGVSALARLDKYTEAFTIGQDTYQDNAEFRKNGGAWSTSTLHVANGDTLQIRLKTDRWNRTFARTIYVGGISDSVSLTTPVEDQTPDAFQFIDIPQAEVGTQYFSNTVTITGINSGVTLTSGAVGAMLSLNGGVFKHTVFVQNGDTLQLYKGTSDGANHTATVTMGSFTETWILGDPNPPSGNQQMSAIAFTPSSNPISFNDVRYVVGPDYSVAASLYDWRKEGGFWDTSFTENSSLPLGNPISLTDLMGRKGEWKVELPHGFSVVDDPNFNSSSTLGVNPIIPPGQLNPPLEAKFDVNILYTNGALTITGDGVWTDIGSAALVITRNSVGETFGEITLHVRRKNSTEDVTKTAEFNLILRHEDEEF